jgi:hypothetical protein
LKIVAIKETSEEVIKPITPNESEYRVIECYLKSTTRSDVI